MFKVLSARLEGGYARERAVLPFGVPVIDRGCQEEGWR
jgi:hypothetical protein